MHGQVITSDIIPLDVITYDSGTRVIKCLPVKFLRLMTISVPFKQKYVIVFSLNDLEISTDNDAQIKILPGKTMLKYSTNLLVNAWARGRVQLMH